jgi:hypothetical protein
VALAQPSPVITIGSRKPRAVWALWIVASVVAAALGALAAGEIRSFGQSAATSSGHEFAYLATVISGLIASAGQWLILWRYRLDAFWWVPATVAADLLSAVVLVPTVLKLFLSSSAVPSGALAILIGALALGASGLLVGTAQGFVLKAAGASEMLLWIGATAFGGVLSGALTTLLSRQLLSLPGLVAIAALAGTGSLLTAAAQSPVLVRLFQKRP